MKRRGHTLIELVTILGLSATLLIVSAGWIHQSLKVGSVVSNRQEHHQSLLRLGRQLREDVNGGDSIVMADDNQLVIMRGDQTLHYTIQDERLMYQSRFGDKVVDQDVFKLSQTATAHWETFEMPDWISLVVDRGGATKFDLPSTSAMKTAIDLHVRANVGRWQKIRMTGTTP